MRRRCRRRRRLRRRQRTTLCRGNRRTRSQSDGERSGTGTKGYSVDRITADGCFADYCCPFSGGYSITVIVVAFISCFNFRRVGCCRRGGFDFRQFGVSAAVVVVFVGCVVGAGVVVVVVVVFVGCVVGAGVVVVVVLVLVLVLVLVVVGGGGGDGGGQYSAGAVVVVDAGGGGVQYSAGAVVAVVVGGGGGGGGGGGVQITGTSAKAVRHRNGRHEAPAFPCIRYVRLHPQLLRIDWICVDFCDQFRTAIRSFSPERRVLARYGMTCYHCR